MSPNSRGDVGRSSGGRHAGAERGVRALRGALGLPDPRLPSVPRPDQGQGGAPDPLRAPEFLLRSSVPERCGPERTGSGVAAGSGERAGERGAEGESADAIRARRAGVSEAAGAMIVSTGGIIARGSAGGAGRHRGATVADGVRGDDAMSLAMSRRDRVRAKLADLKLPGALEAVDAVLARADGGGLSVAAALEEGVHIRPYQS